MGAKGTYILRGKQGDHIVKTQTFNIDNGAGTTIDDVLLANLPWDIELLSVEAVYAEATDTAGAASANFKLGIAVAGATIVGATALEAAKAVGDVTTGTILISRLIAGQTLFVRHTGVATTEVGTYYVQVRYRIVGK